MTYLQHPETEKRYPLRYWMMMVYTTGIPNFVKFDTSGLTHKVGLLNPTSVSAILMTTVTAFLLIAITLLNRQRLMARPVEFSKWVWIVLFVNLVISTLLSSQNPKHPGSLSDILISLFRLSGWLVGILLAVSLYSREPEESATDMIVRIIGTSCWFNIIFIWIMLPILPSLVFGDDGESANATRRLGGLMIGPGLLGTEAGIAFFFQIFFVRGLKKWVGCFVAIVTLAMTYAREPQLAFCVVAGLYFVFLSGRTIYRWAGAFLLAVVVPMGALFFDRIVAYAARGNGVKNIVTLSDRTYVWQASWKAFLLRPILGYGAVKGVSNAIKDQWVFTHWVPPECHNEILQALVSGGILAGVLVLFLFVQIIWKGFRIRAYGEKQTFLLVVLLEVTFVGIGNAVISGGFARSSALFLLAFVGVSGSYSRVRASLKARKQRLVYIGHQSSQPVSA